MRVSSKDVKAFIKQYNNNLIGKKDVETTILFFDNFVVDKLNEGKDVRMLGFGLFELKLTRYFKYKENLERVKSKKVDILDNMRNNVKAKLIDKYGDKYKD